MDIEVLKSYLVNLGFQVNQPELRKFEMGLKDAASLVESTTTGVVSSLIKWQIAGIAAFASVSGAVVSMADHVASADQKYRLLGLRMFMTTEQARKMQMGMDALGASLEEIAWDPELNANFLKLADLQDKLQAGLGPKFAENMRGIRDMQQKVREFRMELEYLSYGFVSRLFEKMGTSIEDLEEKLQGLIDWLADEKNFKQVTDWLANQFVPILKDAWEIFKALGAATGTVLTLFTNLIGLLSGDHSIEGTELSFYKVATAVQHVVHGVTLLLEALTHAEMSLVHFANAAVLALSGKVGEAKEEFMSGIQEAKWDPDAMPAKQQDGSSSSSSGPQNASAQASQARDAAIRVGRELDVDPRLVFEQWQHETNNFQSSAAHNLNNLGGIRSRNKSGGYEYRKYSSVDDYASDYINVLRAKRYGGVRGAHTEEEFARGLKAGGYYENIYDKNGREFSVENYIAGMKRFGRQDVGLFSGGGNQNVTVNSTVIIHQPGASPEKIQEHVTRGIATALNKQTQRNVAQLAFG